MPLSPDRAAELAELLPQGLACTDARTRLLCIGEILRTLTDTRHPLSNADIRAILQARFGISPAENTVAADLRALRDAGALGLAVHVTPSGAWCEQRQLSPANVRLLLNAVQASRFLTSEQGAELQDGLLGLVSTHQQDDLMSEVFVDQRVPRSYQQEVFDSCDRIARALRRGRKLVFTYTYTGFDGKPHAIESDDGQTRRVETPIALLFSEGNYYLESYASTPWRHGVHVLRSRVDRMVDVRVADEPADDIPAVRAARANIRRRMREGFEMVDGPSRIVFLRVRADATNVMYDRFGFGLRFGQLEGPRGDVGTTALTCVHVGQTFTFYRWLSAARDGSIVIAAPPSELELTSGPWRTMLRGVARDELTRDYEAMVEGYRTYLAAAGAPYHA